MSGLTMALETAKNAILSTEIQLGTASHNIANADNKAYAKQRALLVTNPALETASGFLGMGARVDQIIQQRDQFIDRSLITSISKESDYETRSTLLETAGAQLFDNGGQGISSALGTFWDSWEALSRNPSGLSERTSVTQAAKNLASTIRDVAGNLADTAGNIEEKAKSEVATVKTLLDEIASYSDAILNYEVGGQSANDLRDLRYEALTKLAESLPISYEEETYGTIKITLTDYSGEITLVSGTQAGTITYDSTNHRVIYSDFQGASYPTPPDSDPPEENQLSAGRLNGVLTVYKEIGTSHDLDDVLADPGAADLTYVDRLNAFTSMLISKVNTAFGSDVFTGADASDINLDSGFSIDAGFDSSVALSVSLLQEEKPDELGNSSFSGYLSDIQQKLGLEQEQALAQGSFQESLRQQLEDQQASISGVSVDEEMIEILKFQQVYQAAAKVIQHTAEMLDVITKMV